MVSSCSSRKDLTETPSPSCPAPRGLRKTLAFSRPMSPRAGIPLLRVAVERFSTRFCNPLYALNPNAQRFHTSLLVSTPLAFRARRKAANVAAVMSPVRRRRQGPVSSNATGPYFVVGEPRVTRSMRGGPKAMRRGPHWTATRARHVPHLMHYTTHRAAATAPVEYPQWVEGAPKRVSSSIRGRLGGRRRITSAILIRLGVP